MEPLTRGHREVSEAISDFRTGRDEMNLVEFPFATLSERAASSRSSNTRSMSSTGS